MDLHPRGTSVPLPCSHAPSIRAPSPPHYDPTPRTPDAATVSYLPVTAVLRQVEHRQRACHHQAQPLHKHRRVSHGPLPAPGPSTGGGQQRGVNSLARERGACAVQDPGARAGNAYQGILVDVGPLNLLGSVPSQDHGSAQHIQVLLPGRQGRRTHDTGVIRLPAPAQ